MSGPFSIADSADWLKRSELQRLFGVLCADGGEARIAGGAVRNTLLGEPVADIDIATTLVPDEVIERCKAANFRTIPTGIDHGTVTVMTGDDPVEVTTLRADIETDGRHAVVRFGRDWQADAERRDFTINALYADADGTVHDLVGGIADIESRTIRFIGDADQRIREDYLRILRFFRFFARYGSGRPDAEGLKACTRLKSGLDQLSAERVWSELKKILGAVEPSRALLWMRQTGVLTAVLPESEKWGIDLIGRLMAAEKAFGWRPDPMLRLEAIVPANSERAGGLADRLRLSNDERGRLQKWAGSDPFTTDIKLDLLKKQIYRKGRQPLLDRLRLALASEMPLDTAAPDKLPESISLAEGWEIPKFPLQGKDLLAAGFQPGPAMGDLLVRLEDAWIESGFELTKTDLLARASDKI